MAAKSAFELLERIDNARPLGQQLELFVEFMLRSCELIVENVPSAAQHALGVARRYWSGQSTSAELEYARVTCWRYLDSIGASTKTADPAVWGTRAVLCVLYPTLKDQDPVELAHWFVTLTSKVSDIDQQQRAILAELFDQEASSP